jgi:hypothetical protein
MAASKAFHPEVCACSHDFPLLAPARMLLTELHDISKTVLVRHLHTPPFHVLRQPLLVAAAGALPDYQAPKQFVGCLDLMLFIKFLSLKLPVAARV